MPDKASTAAGDDTATPNSVFGLTRLATLLARAGLAAAALMLAAAVVLTFTVVIPVALAALQEIYL